MQKFYDGGPEKINLGSNKSNVNVQPLKHNQEQ